MTTDALEHPQSFVFGKSTPDSIRLTKRQRVVAALHDDRAFGAQSFGFVFALAPRASTLAVGVEEHRKVRTAASGRQLPRPGFSVSGDRRCR